MNLDFLVGKTITKAWYATNKQVVTLHFDDDTLYGWASMSDYPNELCDCGDKVYSFEEIDRIENSLIRLDPEK